jgi:chemotaxis protein MotA
MSLPSLFGVIVGLALLLTATFLATNNPMIYINIEALCIVLGGSIATAFMGYHHPYVMIAFKAMGWMFKKPKSTREGLNVEILRLIKWAYLVQQKGLPGLEKEIKNVKANDPIVKYCLELIASAHRPEELRQMMSNAVESEFERKTIPVQVLKGMASSGPAFGMIGTLVGLIAVLESMGAGATELMRTVGLGMAVAMTATLYGVLFARMVCLPAANKLLQYEEEERFRNLMMVEGLIMLAERKSPRFMQDKLNSFLEPARHFNLDVQMRALSRAANLVDQQAKKSAAKR